MEQGQRRQIARREMQPGVIRMAERPGFQDEPDIGERGQNRPASGFDVLQRRGAARLRF
jgi:hypothetical protein